MFFFTRLSTACDSRLLVITFGTLCETDCSRPKQSQCFSLVTKCRFPTAVPCAVPPKQSIIFTTWEKKDQWSLQVMLYLSQMNRNVYGYKVEACFWGLFAVRYKLLTPKEYHRFVTTISCAIKSIKIRNIFCSKFFLFIAKCSSLLVFQISKVSLNFFETLVETFKNVCLGSCYNRILKYDDQKS